MSTYYGELCTLAYEESKSLANGKELEFFLSYVQDKSIKVLEPMCGNGRMLIPLMQRGIDIDGFDISEEMLEVCKSKGRQRNLEPNVTFGNIEEFRSEKLYDLIMIPFGSFSLLPDQLVKPSLNNLKTLLKKNGTLLLTIITNKGNVREIPNWQETNRYLIDHKVIIEYKKVKYDKIHNSLNTTLKYELVSDGHLAMTEIMEFPIRLYEAGEFEFILESNGFNKFTLHNVTGGYGEGNDFQVFECRL